MTFECFSQTSIGKQMRRRQVEDMKPSSNMHTCRIISVYEHHFNNTSCTINYPCRTDQSCKWIKALSCCNSPRAAQVFVDYVPMQAVTEHETLMQHLESIQKTRAGIPPQLKWRYLSKIRATGLWCDTNSIGYFKKKISVVQFLVYTSK